MAASGQTGQVSWGGILGASTFGLLAVASLLPAGLSVMIFDAPGSTSNPLTVALFAVVAGAPLVFLASALLLTLGTITKRRALTWIALLAPVALLLYLGAVVVLLDRVCGGNFVCR